MALTTPTLGFNGYVDLRNSYGCIRALRRCHLSNLVQCKNEEMQLQGNSRFAYVLHVFIFVIYGTTYALNKNT